MERTMKNTEEIKNSLMTTGIWAYPQSKIQHVCACMVGRNESTPIIVNLYQKIQQELEQNEAYLDT